MSPLVERVQKIMATAPYQWRERFARAVFSDPNECFRRPDFQAEWEVRYRDVDLPMLLEAGYVLVDGSGFYGDFPSIRCAGWSAVLYGSERRCVGVLYGAVPPLFGPQQVARDG